MRAEQTSFLFGANAPFIEELYGRDVADAGRVVITKGALEHLQEALA